MHGGDIYNNRIEHDFSVNLNPFGPYPEVKNAVRDAVENISAYPEYGAVSLKEELIKKLSENVALCSSDESESENQEKQFHCLNAAITNGASEGIMSIVRAVNASNAIVEVPSFFGYEYALNASEKINVDYVFRNEILKDDFSIKNNSLVMIANPTNPTGEFSDISEIDSLYLKIKDAGSYLIIDESFISISDFYMSSFIEKIYEKPDYYDRLFIIRSFTKSFSIPGVRLGYVVSSNISIMDRLNKMLPEWNVSVLALAAGKECLKHTDRLLGDVNKIKIEREYLVGELRGLGLKVLESCTPYVLFTGKNGLYEALLEKGILIRNCDNYRGINIYKKWLNPHLDRESKCDEVGIYRAAVKTREENEILINEMKGILNE